MRIAVSARIRKSMGSLVEGMLPDCTIDWLEDMNPEDRISSLTAADIVLSRNLVGDLTKEELALLDRPKMVQTTRTGVDHLDFSVLPKGMHLYCNSGGWARGIAESACGMIIALNRCLREQLLDLRAGDFHILGYHQKLLSEQTVLIAGFGGIGQAVAEVLSPFHPKLMAISRHKPQSSLLAESFTMDRWEEAVRQADVLVLAMPCTKETEGLVDGHILSLMKKDAMIVDVARAALIDHEALLQHVKENPNFHVAMDVWWQESEDWPKEGDPLLALPNVIGSAHNAEMSSTAYKEALKNALTNIRAFMDGKPVKGKVNSEEY